MQEVEFVEMRVGQPTEMQLIVVETLEDVRGCTDTICSSANKFVIESIIASVMSLLEC